MQQRHEPDDSLDDFATPPWATRALIETVLKPSWFGGRKPFGEGFALEPCCNRGYMAMPLQEYFGDRLYCSDVHDYGWSGQGATSDFLFPKFEYPLNRGQPDWIFANPPFRLAQEFIDASRRMARVGYAMLVRTSFLEGVDRYKNLWSKNPPNIVAQFSERVIMHKGVLRDPEKLYWDPEATNPQTKEKTGWWKKPSTATSYMWLVWVREWIVREHIVWIPPCRRKLTRPGDYPLNPDEKKSAQDDGVGLDL